jgi:hypothetical protein
MKALLMIFVASVALAAETNTVPQSPLEEKFQQAVLLARVGLYDEAAGLCNEILKEKPDQPTVKELLHEVTELKRKKEAQDPGFALRHQLEQITLPEVSFREANPKDVLDYLGGETKRYSTDNIPINFVWLVPAETKLRPVSLNLKNVPFIDVLGYVTRLAGLKYRVEAHAVVIYKPEPEKPIPPASEPLHVKPQ